MKTDLLDKWKPCQSYCQLAGAAAAILSIRGGNVIFNGPRWCSLIAERELSTHNYDYMYRIYCSHIEQCDLLFGTEDKLEVVFDEIAKEKEQPSILGVLTSCSIGLIGDDVQGIVAGHAFAYPSFALDAGGLTGLYEEGYQAGMLGILKCVGLEKREPKPGRVNLLGLNNTDPHNSGDIIELKRLLELSGIEVGVCLGQEDLPLEELQKLPEAALNIVLVEELGLKIAEYLKANLEQNYMVCAMPYGLKATKKWLEKIGAALQLKLETKAIDYELYRMNEDLGQYYAMMKYRIPNLRYRGARLYMPYSKAVALAEAMEEELLQLKEIELRIEGNYKREADKDMARVELDQDTYDILFGTVNDRILEGNYANTVYVNCFKPESIIKNQYKTYVGIKGWGELVGEIFRQTLTLNFLKEEGMKHV